jgi:hypothetical protein
MGVTTRRRARVAQKIRAARSGNRVVRRPPSPASTFRIRELDPQRKCGAGTSVQRLYRIDESIDGAVRSHLVYLDRHGWYCEHGRDCAAVLPARNLAERKFH